MTVPNDPSLATAIVTWTEPTASDNSQSEVTLVPSKPSGSTFDLGKTTVRYLATDEAGYTSECTFQVTVQGKMTSNQIVVDVIRVLARKHGTFSISIFLEHHVCQINMVQF